MEKQEFAAVWRALADPTRRRIVDLLMASPLTTGQIDREFAMSRIGVMKHLGILADADLITSRKRGRERWHYLNGYRLQALARHLLDPVQGRWAEALERLRNAAEGETAMNEARSGQLPLAIDIAQDIRIAAPTAKVFGSLTDDVGAWWGRPWLSDAATGLELERRLEGSFRELWPGGGRLLARVTAIDEGRRLELTGRLQLGVVQSVADFVLEPDGDGTLLRLTHQVIGSVPPDLAAAFRDGWTDLLDVRLRAFAERGERRGIAGED